MLATATKTCSAVLEPASPCLRHPTTVSMALLLLWLVVRGVPVAEEASRAVAVRARASAVVVASVAVATLLHQLMIATTRLACRAARGEYHAATLTGHTEAQGGSLADYVKGLRMEPFKVGSSPGCRLATLQRSYSPFRQSALP